MVLVLELEALLESLSFFRDPHSLYYDLYSKPFDSRVGVCGLRAVMCEPHLVKRRSASLVASSLRDR